MSSPGDQSKMCGPYILCGPLKRSTSSPLWPGNVDPPRSKVRKKSGGGPKVDIPDLAGREPAVTFKATLGVTASVP